MADSRSRSEWSRMASLMALVWNVTLCPKRPMRPADFDPYASSASHRGRIVLSGNQMVSMLEQAFCGNRQP